MTNSSKEFKWWALLFFLNEGRPWDKKELTILISKVYPQLLQTSTSHKSLSSSPLMLILDLSCVVYLQILVNIRLVLPKYNILANLENTMRLKEMFEKEINLYKNHIYYTFISRYSSMYLIQLLLLSPKLKVFHFSFKDEGIKKHECSISFVGIQLEKYESQNSNQSQSLSLMVFSFLLYGPPLYTAFLYKTRTTFSNSGLFILTIQDLGQGDRIKVREDRSTRSIYW